MDKKDLERRLETAEKQNLGLLDEIKNLKAKLAEMQDEPEIPDKPDFELNEKFYYLDSMTADVEDSCHGGDIDAIDFNMFHQEEYAQEFRRKCKLIAMMLHCKWYLCPDYVPDFTNSNEEKHYVYYDACGEKYTTDWRCATINNEVFFDTEENAQKAADWLNKHWKENTDE